MAGGAGHSALEPRIASIAGSNVRQAATVTTTPIASTGPRPRVAGIEATLSASIAPATVAPLAAIAGPASRVASRAAAPAGSPRASAWRKRATSSRQ